MNLIITEYREKKIAVIGLAVSNTPLIKYLAEKGANLTVFDQKPATELNLFLQQLAGLNLKYQLGPDYLDKLTGFDLIFLTPGMKKNLPQLNRAKAEGALFSSEMEVFLRECPAKILGITGSSGKTTTTTLIGLMLGSVYHTFVGGNIGCSLLERLPEMDANSYVVLELSSFQLQELKQSPDLAVITNVTPNHLDMHASMDEYIEAKSNILRYQNPSGLAVLNQDNEITSNLASLTKAKTYFFSRCQELAEGAFLKGTELVIRLNGRTESLLDRHQLKLLGDHNVENVLTAALVGRLMGVPIANLAKVAQEFTGVEHRLELVRELKGVKYYNDSISTTPDRAIAGLRAMTRPTVLIAGGYDKHLPFDNLALEIVERCKHLVLLGVTAPQIEAAVRRVNKDFPITTATSFAGAVSSAVAVAGPSDVVLLSPACASYDMFNNYQERGCFFKELISAL